MINSKPKISVIIPLYNGKKYLKELFDSVFDQNFKNFEVIVVDDGSTDNPYEILDSLNNKIEIIKQKNSGCPAGAKNAGIKRAKGEYIAFLDQDDIWLPDKLEKQLAALEGDRDLTMVCDNTQIVDASGKLLAKVWPDPEIWRKTNLRLRLAHGNVILTSSSVLIKKEFFERYGSFNEKIKLTDDFEMWFRVSLYGKILLMNESLSKWRLHDENFSRNSERARQDILKCYEEIYKLAGLSGDDRKIITEMKSTMAIRLANYYLTCGNFKKAFPLYQNHTESKSVRIVLSIAKISPSLARIIVKMKIFLSEVFLKLPRKREVVFPGGGAI